MTENMQVHYDAAQKWYYLEDQEPSELLIFRQAESHPAGRVGKFDESGPNPPVSMNDAYHSSRRTPLIVPESFGGYGGAATGKHRSSDVGVLWKH